MTAPATITIYDDIFDSAGNPVANARIQCVLDGREETTAGGLVVGVQQSTTTDPNGHFTFTVVCNDLLSPANSTYTIQTPFRTYQIAPQSANGNSQRTTAPNVIVNTPTPLAPATSNITGNLTIAGFLTVAGLITAQAGLAITGGTLSITAGGFSMAGPLTLTTAASQIVPGATSFSVRDNANANDNLLVSNAGVLTVRAGLVVSGGSLTLPAASIADAALSANVPLKNAANTFSALQTISAGGLAVTGGITAATGGVTATAGNLTATAGNLVFGAATAKIVPGATGLNWRNNADSASNLAMTDTGLAVFRNAISVPPSAGAALPSTAYGTLPVKLDEQSGAGPTASLTLTVPAGALYRTLWVDFTGRSDQAGVQPLLATLNADAGANYDYQFVQDTNVTVTGVAPTVAGTTGRCGVLVPSGATAGAVSSARVIFENADSTTLRKGWLWQSGGWTTDAAGSSIHETGQGQWRNVTTALTSILLKGGAGNLVNWRAVLYGLP